MINRSIIQKCLWAALLALTVSACTSRYEEEAKLKAAQGGGSGNEVGVIAVGNDLAGEPCRATQSVDIVEALGAAKVLDLKCGNWTKPSGHLAEAGGSATIVDLKAIATEGAWRNDLDQKLICQPPQETKILNGVPAAWLRCARRNGGLPHVAFVTSISGKIYYIDGLPPSQPALERLAGQLAGVVQADSTDATQSSSATELLKEQFNGKLVGNADRAQYDRLMQLGRGFNNEGSYAQAIVYYRDALKLQQQLMGPNNAEAIQPMMNLAVALSNKQNFSEANEVFQRANELITPQTDPAERALFTYNRAINEANQHHSEAALKLAQEAAALFQQLAGDASKPANRPDKNQLFSLGEADTENKNTAGKVNFDISLVEAQALAARMSRQVEGAGQSQKIVESVRPVAVKNEERSPDAFANVLQVSAANLNELGDKEQAEKDLRAGIAELDKHLANSQPQARAYMLLGSMLAAQGRFSEALAPFRTAAQVAKTKNLTFPVQIIFPYLDSLYAVASKEPAEASALYAEMFEASQLARSGTAAQFVSEAAAQLAQGSGDAAGAIRDFREKKTDFERVQNKLDEELARPKQEQDPIEIAKLDEQVKTAEKEKDDAETRVQVLAPNFNMLRLKTIHTDDVVKVMRPGEAVYYILLGDKTSYAFFIKDGKTISYKVPLTNTQAGKMVGRVRSAFIIRAGNEGEPTFSSFDPDSAFDLYQAIFKPIDGQLDGLSKLVVAQSGALLSLPFALLVTKDPPDVVNEDYTKVNFLIQRTAISYVTSMQSFVILREAQAGNRAPKPFIGFGDYQQPSRALMASYFSDPTCKQDLQSLEELGPLPGTRPEVEAVAQTMGVGAEDEILGRNFNKVTLAGIDLSQFRILHFATHALLPTDLKCRQSPTMLASLPPGSTNLADIFFDTGDILKLKLNADLVVLSACNTSSQGEIGSGESLSGLAQAFFISGARGLLVSHWLAADQSTVALMKTLYTQFATRRIDTANALRIAQTDMISRSGKDLPILFSHPLFWAVFTAVGDGVQPDAAASASVEPPVAIPHS
jgi:CHAT domain-containing protein